VASKKQKDKERRSDELVIRKKQKDKERRR